MEPALNRLATVNKSAVDESVLITRAQDDPKHFKPLYEMYYRTIFVFVHHRTGDKSLTADITSQVFLKALLNIKKFRSQGVPFSAWLYRIALNECFSHFRKINRHRHVSVDEHSLEQFHEELTAETSLADLEAQLPVILQQLSVEELHLLELRFFERRPFKEVGDILQITETHAKVRIYRLLDKMRKLFMERTR